MNFYILVALLHFLIHMVYDKLFLQADGYKINTTVVCPFFIRSTGMFDDVSTRYKSFFAITA